ncbi:MAG: hypothetical protein KAU58_05620 [Candidatus Omnitrophica bacterium]|nr:hypothetical protein [Candidatus Omnitrophota bacterium]
MGNRKVLGFEDIRKQPAYKAGARMRKNIKGATSAKDAQEKMKKEYKKLNKVDRELFRHGWTDK